MYGVSAWGGRGKGSSVVVSSQLSLSGLLESVPHVNAQLPIPLELWISYSICSKRENGYWRLRRADRARVKLDGMGTFGMSRGE